MSTKTKLSFNINNENEIPDFLSKETAASLKRLQKTIERIRTKFDSNSNFHNTIFENEGEPIKILSQVELQSKQHLQTLEVLSETLKIQEIMLRKQESSGKAIFFATNIMVCIGAATLVVSALF